MSSSPEAEDMLPNIGELPPNVQRHLRKFASIAKDALAKRDDALKRLQGLENLGRIVQEYQAENVRNQDQFKWYEIVLLRTEADLARTKKKLLEEANEKDKLLQRLRVTGQLSPEDDPTHAVIDRADGPSAKTPPGDETDKKPSSATSPSSSRQRFLAPVFVGVSENIHNRTLQELEETRGQLRSKVEKDGVTYKEYLDAEKSELQIQKLQETIKHKGDRIVELTAENEKLRGEEKDKVIASLKEENEKHNESNDIKVQVIEASNRRCQELKEENEELRRKYKELSSKRQDSHQTEGSGGQMSRDERRVLQKQIEELRLREEQLLLENHRVRIEKDNLKKQYDSLRCSFEAGAPTGGEAAHPKGGCKSCKGLLEEITRMQEQNTALDKEKVAAVHQMKLFEDDFRQSREQLKHNEQKHLAEISDSMKNIQMLSQELDRSKEEIQKTRDHNQALEYQLSLLSQEYRRPYYSMDPRAAQTRPQAPTHNPGAMPWQEGYHAPGRGRAMDVADGPRDIEADSAYTDLKGEESEEEAELTRR